MNIDRIKSRILAIWAYVSEGIWEDHRNTLKVRTVKTLNLTVRTFLSTDLQSQACAMTYRTMLAVVPALALLFAIGRGFGFQNVLADQLMSSFPSQHKALETAFSFVDSCLAQASEGVFVGVGIVFLLWTIISLLDSVEVSFNEVFGVRTDRSLPRKLTDYLAICIILPILMIVSSGVQVFMSTAIQKLLPFDALSPVVEVVLDFASVVFAWFFFTGAYLLIPNTRVRLGNAFLAGALAGTAFQVLQWLFVTGQLYVAKYNAIYGSFSFLPLMLIWMQLSWLITLAGALICSSSQNISMFSFYKQTRSISFAYRREVAIALLTVIIRRFKEGKEPLSDIELANKYKIPTKLVSIILIHLIECGFLVRVTPLKESEPSTTLILQPAMSLDHYTLAHVQETIANHGANDFIPNFGTRFAPVVDLCREYRLHSTGGNTLLSDIDIPD